MDCTLPVTGSNLALMPLALAALAVGTLLTFLARRWGLRGGLTAVLVLAVGMIGLGARNADAQTTCPPETTPTAEATTVAPTQAPTTTIAPTTTVASTGSTTSTASTSATTTVGTGVVGTPGGQSASVPDLTIDLAGPLSLTAGARGSVTMTITNIGPVATSGTMMFTLSELPAGIAVFPTGMTTTDWSAVQTSTGWAFTSNANFVIASGASSTITFDVAVPTPGANTSLTLNGVLPPGIGGETNATNNQDSTTISLIAGAG
jgi:hypothetical protein